MKRKSGTPRLYLASSGMEKMPVANAKERLLSLAILELRMELHKVTDSELKALCDLMEKDEQAPQVPDSGGAKRLPSYLKLIK